MFLILKTLVMLKKDSDGDGWTNLEEFNMKPDSTDPTDPTNPGMKPRTVQIILLILGLLIMAGCGAFLVYYRKVIVAEQTAVRQLQIARQGFQAQNQGQQTLAPNQRQPLQRPGTPQPPGPVPQTGYRQLLLEDFFRESGQPIRLLNQLL